MTIATKIKAVEVWRKPVLGNVVVLEEDRPGRKSASDAQFWTHAGLSQRKVSDVSMVASDAEFEESCETAYKLSALNNADVLEVVAQGRSMKVQRTCFIKDL